MVEAVITFQPQRNHAQTQTLGGDTGVKRKFTTRCKSSLLFFSLIDQGSRFEVSAVGSLCLPKLVYYTTSAFHSKHVLMHLSNSHQLHIKTRDAVRSIQELEDIEGRGWC